MYNIPLYQITPYHLKDSQDHIFENIWQGSKLYARVEAQNEIKAGMTIWSHPAQDHLVNEQLTPEFWAWRKKLWNNPHAVRYPNGFHGRHKCICALWPKSERTPTGEIEWEQLAYVPARKRIYCSVYAQLVQNTEAYRMLKQLHDSGVNLQLCEMDVRPGLITEEVLRRELHNEEYPFGHGYVLAACLLNLTHIFNE